MQHCSADTIFAPATAAGRGGVAVIRISGPDALVCLAQFCPGRPVVPRMATWAVLKDPKTQEVLDKAIFIYFKSPNSYTGEECVELHIHGGRAVLDGVLAALAALPSYRLAEPGEFTRRAFQNDKMDLTEAEAVADLIDANTKAQRKQALRQLSGAASDLCQKWRQQLKEAMAYLESWIDFPDEDLPDTITDSIRHNILCLKDEISQHIVDSRRGERLRSGYVIVLAGAPNVGKSSLCNALVERDVAIVSDMEGTTRDSIETYLEWDGFPVILIDTAGLRESDDKIEQEGIKRTKNKAKEADLILHLHESMNRTDESDLFLSQIDAEKVSIHTKADLLNDQVHHNASRSESILISALTGFGMDRLKETIGDKIRESMTVTAPTMTRLRHRQALIDSLEALNDFSLDKELELAAEDLRFAADALGRITGRINVDEILDTIFGSFCIGK